VDAFREIHNALWMWSAVNSRWKPAAGPARSPASFTGNQSARAGMLAQLLLAKSRTVAIEICGANGQEAPVVYLLVTLEEIGALKEFALAANPPLLSSLQTLHVSNGRPSQEQYWLPLDGVFPGSRIPAQPRRVVLGSSVKPEPLGVKIAAFSAAGNQEQERVVAPAGP